MYLHQQVKTILQAAMSTACLIGSNWIEGISKKKKKKFVQT